MGKRRKKRAAETQTQSVSTPAAPGDESRTWLLVGAVVLLVARPFLPSEGVAWLGDGLPFDMLWLILAALFFFHGLVRGQLRFRFGVTDALVLLLVGLSVTSCLITKSVGARASLNMLWEWVAVGALFVLTRQLVNTARKSRWSSLRCWRSP